MKKGYTLIELIIVLSISTLLFSISVTNIVKFKENMNNVEFENTAVEVKALLSFAKTYCRKNKVPGQIIIGSDRKTITFQVTDRNFPINKSIKLKDNIEIGSNFTSSTDIKSDSNNISDEGYIKSAGTIVITNDKNKVIRITISVGSDIIRSYSNDEEEGDIIQ